MPPDPQFVAGQRVVKPGPHSLDAQQERRLALLEQSPGPARFELVSPIDYEVGNEMVFWLGIPEDCDGFHLIAVSAFLLIPNNFGDTAVTIEDADDSGIQLLDNPCVVLDSETSSATNPDQPVINQENRTVFWGQRLVIFSSVGEVGNGVGLAVALSFA